MDNSPAFAKYVADLVVANLAPAEVVTLYANTTPGQIEEGVPQGGYLLHTHFGPVALAAGAANKNIYNQCKIPLTFRLFTRATEETGTYEALLERKVNLDRLYSAAVEGIKSFIISGTDDYIGIDNSTYHLAEVNDYMVDGIICATYRVDVRFFV